MQRLWDHRFHRSYMAAPRFHLQTLPLEVAEALPLALHWQALCALLLLVGELVVPDAPLSAQKAQEDFPLVAPLAAGLARLLRLETPPEPAAPLLAQAHQW